MKQLMKFTRHSRFATLVLATAAVTAPAFGQITTQGGGYLMRMKFSANQKVNYKMNMTNPMTGQPITMTMSMLTKAVRGTTADVEYNVSGKGPDGKTTNQKVTATMDNRGKIIKSSSPGASQLSNTVYPEKAVKVGGTWTGSVNQGGMIANSTYKLVGMKTINGIPCAQVAVSLTGGAGQVKVTGSGTLYIRVADGSMQSSTMSTNVSMGSAAAGSGAPSNMKIAITISRT